MCPVCREPLIAFELDGVETDRCVRCGGTWLDAGELERITESAGVPPGGLSEALRRARDGSPGPRRCPRCRRKLRSISVGPTGTTELDRCPTGHGLWFDRGEMESLIFSFSEGEEEVVARHFSNLYRREMESNAQGKEGD